MKEHLTIADIARIANVHKSTVSRVFNRPDKVSPDTRRKIEQIIKEHGYRPNTAARALAKGHSRNVAIIVNDRMMSRTIINYVFPELIYSIGSTAANYGYNVTIITSSKEDDSEYINIVKNHDADGFIIFGSRTDDTFPYLFQKEHIPFIVIGRFPGMENSVATNNELGGYQAVKHLLELGNRDITLMCGSRKWHHNVSRLAGARRAFGEFGIDFGSCKIVDNQVVDECYESFRSFLKEAGDNLPDAIFCLNDVFAFAMITAANDFGISIPGDMSLVGFGNELYTQFSSPKITSVSEDIIKIGEIAMNNLYELIRQNERVIPSVALNPTLVIRESTGPCRKNLVEINTAGK